MTHLEIYPVGSTRDDFLAFVACAPQVPTVGSVLVLRTAAGYARYRVDLVEFWYDTVQPDSVPSAVLEVEKID